MVLDVEILRIKAHFESSTIPMSDLWLESCVNWCREQHLENCTENYLRTAVYEQWLLLDLREMEHPSLPPNLIDHKKLSFNTDYCLQILSVVDISKPKHWQLSKIRRANLAASDNTEPDKDLVSCKRMLQLTLTDGVQEIDALEYMPIPSLNLSINLVPGSKVRIIAPVIVRRGKIMLEAKNIKFLGGEVEEIQVSHAIENVLARALGVPENLNPVTLQMGVLNLSEDINNASTQVNVNRNGIEERHLPT